MSQVYPVALVMITRGSRKWFGTFNDFAHIRKGEGYCRSIVTESRAASKGSSWNSLSLRTRFAVEACEGPLWDFLWQAYALGSDHGHTLQRETERVYNLGDRGQKVAEPSEPFLRTVRQASASFSPATTEVGDISWRPVQLATMFRCLGVTMRACMVYTEPGLFFAYEDFGLLSAVERYSDSGGVGSISSPDEWRGLYDEAPPITDYDEIRRRLDE